MGSHTHWAYTTLNRIPSAMSSSLESNFKKSSIIHEEIQIVNKHIGKRFYSP